MASSRFAVTALIAVVPLTAGNLTHAKDLGVLTRVAQAAFLADQGSAVCASSRLDFSTDEHATFRSAKGYAQFIKDKVTAGLTPDETTKVLADAAGAAKSEAQQVFSALRGDPDVANWCKRSVVPFVRQVVGAYERNTAEIDGIIERAKRE
jgi:hypothetical protein